LSASVLATTPTTSGMVNAEDTSVLTASVAHLRP